MVNYALGRRSRNWTIFGEDSFLQHVIVIKHYAKKDSRGTKIQIFNLLIFFINKLKRQIREGLLHCERLFYSLRFRKTIPEKY